LPEVHHHGYAVAEIEAAASWASEVLGAGPFFSITHMKIDRSEMHGREVAFDHTSAFGFCGDLMIELSEIHPATDARLREAMQGEGELPCLTHVAWLADDLDAEARRLVDAGCDCFYRSSTGPASAAWFDSRARLGHCIEVLERSPGLDEFYGFLRAQASGWDGNEPLRSYA
jgi:hypothetical protein